jgi:hypothetical protein
MLRRELPTQFRKPGESIMKMADKKMLAIAFPVSGALAAALATYVPEKALAQETAAHPLHLIEQITTPSKIPLLANHSGTGFAAVTRRS